MNDLKERVDKFNFLELPGQPQSLHVGTSRLVNDLWREVQRLQRALHDIAALDDEGANAQLKATGSYSSFDEPGSVQLAREALALPKPPC